MIDHGVSEKEKKRDWIIERAHTVRNGCFECQQVDAFPRAEGFSSSNEMENSISVRIHDERDDAEAWHRFHHIYFWDPFWSSSSFVIIIYIASSVRNLVISWLRA